MQLGWISYGPEAEAFIKDASDCGMVQGTNWSEWMQTEEAQKLSQDPDRVAVATIDELAMVLTVSIRRDRFMEGSLRADFNSGLITRVVKRAYELSGAAKSQ